MTANPLPILEKDARRALDYSRRNIRIFCAAAASLPLTAPLDILTAGAPKEVFWIRLSASLFAIPFLYRRVQWSEASSVVWYFWLATTVCLPICFGLILATTPAEDEYNFVLLTSYTVSLFIYVQVLNSPILATLGWIFSLAFILLVSAIGFGFSVDNVDQYLPAFFAFLTAVLVGSLTNRNVAAIEAEKLSTARSLGFSIAHELRTPLASIRNRVAAIDKHFPPLLEKAAIHLRDDRNEDLLDSIRLERVDRSLRGLSKDAASMGTIIDVLLRATRTSGFSEAKTVFDSIDIAREAVTSFPYNNDDERALVTLTEVRSFKIQAGYVETKHVLMNLIKNSLYYVQKGRGSRIDVIVGRERNEIRVTDDGPGIPPSIRSKIFQPFFTTTDIHNGSGLGLTYCKVVMESQQGSIKLIGGTEAGCSIALSFPEVAIKDGIETR